MKAQPTTIRLSVGHFCVDAYSSMLGALIPFLFRAHDLSLTQAGILGGFFIFSSSFLQPVYGYLSDRIDSKVFTALGPAVAGVFMCSLGLAPNFEMMLACVFLAGVGIAAFHPQGTAMASDSSPSTRGFQLSFFITSGMLGFSLGPVVIVYLVSAAGLPWALLAAVPGILASVYLLLWGPSPTPAAVHQPRSRVWRQIRDHQQQLFLLFVLVVIRGGIQMAFVALLPLFLVLRGYSEVAAGNILSLFLLSGALACFAGGMLSDAIGGKRVLIYSMAGLVPAMLGFLVTEGPLSIVLCLLGGAFLLLNAPVNVAMAHRLVPHGTGTISALMMGFAWGIGGVSVPILGWASDSVGLTWGFFGLVLLGIPGVLIALALSAETDTEVDPTAELDGVVADTGLHLPE